jgi:hypothetical protein
LLDPEDGVSHYCNMIAVSPFSFADHGDSGGPVYAGQRAYATITGANSAGNRVLVTPIHWISTISGSVTIKTN